MDQSTFIRRFEELLELDANALNASTELATVPQWDSLMILSFISFADREMKAEVSGVAVVACKTVSALGELVGVR